MAYIQPNKLLPPTARVIRPYQCSMIATEGPNILGKLNMSGVEIPYYTQFTTRMVLNPSATKQPLLYGFLGTEVTFILLKFTYDETNPLCNIEEEQFVEYYFEDQPAIIRYASKLLLLTGNSVNRIPQIFLNNPSEVKIYVDAMVANLEQTDINLDNVNYVTISNLYYNNVVSDKVNQCTSETGSTQLQVIGIDGYVQLYLDYVDILTIEPQYDTNELRITTVSDTTIILGFLSSFEMYQALSRISWVMKDPSQRYLTKDYPSVDIVSPLVFLNPLLPTYLISPNVYAYPFHSGTTVYPTDIVNFFITGITDDRDGEISIDSVYITVRQTGHIETLTGITFVGAYDIVLSVSDIANNTTTLNYTILCDDVPPIIYFKPIASGSGFTMTVTDMALPSFGITSEDIITKSVDFVYDTIDGIIPSSNIVLYVNDIISGVTILPVITSPGQYSIIYFVEDSSHNSFSTGKTLTYSGYTILDGGENFILPAGVVSMDFKYVGDSGTTGTTITISGKTFSVTNVSGVTSGMTTGITEVLIWDSVGIDSGGTYYHDFGTGGTDSFTFVVGGTQFTITFTGRASLLFTILNQGFVSDYFSVDTTGLTFASDTGLTDTFTITTNLAWSLSDDIDWLLLSTTYGTGTTTITATTMSENITSEPRFGLTVITTNSGETVLLMTQEAISNYFSVSPSGLSFTSASGTTTIDITTDANWTIYDAISWLSFSVTGGTGSATIIVTVDENTSLVPRNNTIFMIGDIDDFHEVVDITVSQSVLKIK